MKWQSFVYNDKEYDLSHLHPFEWVCKQAANKDKPEREYHFDVVFSLHCFTKSHGNDEPAAAASLCYSDTRETRQFCFYRYELSKKLPDIIKSLHERKCLHTGHGNYFTIELVDENNEKRHYEVYFTVTRSSKKGRMTLYVNSAYARDEAHGRSPIRRPIRFYVIAYNTQIGKKIKIQK